MTPEIDKGDVNMKNWYLLKNLSHRRFVLRKSHIGLFVVGKVAHILRNKVLGSLN
jgi:hypothetical protein